MTEQRIVLTGAAGRLGSALRPRLRRPGRELILLDMRPLAVPAVSGEVFVEADVRDGDSLAPIVRGAHSVVHVGGHASERPWHEIVDVNVGGTLGVLQAMAASGVRRIFHASSIHASGFEPMAHPSGAARPDTYYGVGKLAAEALLSLYADRAGMIATSARIANFTDRPDSLRGLSLWLSPDDAARLVEASIARLDPGHRVIWGVSANTRGVLDLTPGAEMGYHPLDDAEVFASTIADAPVREPLALLGASFTVRPLGG
jgi:NADP-dependent aldehyde dehydrogenase